MCFQNFQLHKRTNKKLLDQILNDFNKQDFLVTQIICQYLNIIRALLNHLYSSRSNRTESFSQTNLPFITYIRKPQ